jgi:IS30 family transposase
MKLPNKEAFSVMKAFEKLSEEFGEYFNSVFKSVTTDNGSEFSSLSEFIPKGRDIGEFSLQYISDVAHWANSLPRKILGYKSPEEAFVYEFGKF